MSFRNDAFLANGRNFLENSSDVHGALQHLVQSAVRFAGSDSGSLYLLDRPQGILRPYVLVNFQDEYLSGCSTVPLGTQCCGRAALHRMPWVVEDMAIDPLFADCREAALKSRTVSGFSIPVMTETECLGTLGFQFRHRYVPDQGTIELMQKFAELLVLALMKEVELTGAKNCSELLAVREKSVVCFDLPGARKIPASA